MELSTLNKSQTPPSADKRRAQYSHQYSAVSAVADNRKPNGSSRIPTRLSIGIMTFLACCATFMSRTNISINLLAMVQPPSSPNGTAISMPDYGPRYTWSPAEQSALLGAFHYGAFVTVLPLGILVDRYGHVRQIIAASFLLNGLLQFTSPTVAAHSVAWLIVIGVTMGATQSTVFSSAHKLITKWSPPAEIGKFTSYAMGTSVGTLIGWSLSGAAIEFWGWRWSFYVNGALMLLLTAIWWWSVYDSPAEHPRCSAEERDYIERSLVGVSATKSWPPLGRLLTSGPIWAIVLLQFGNLWGFFFIVTGGPKFINEVLGFPIASTGLLASMPYVVRSLTGLVFAVMADAMRKRELMSVMNLRRVFCVFSHIIPGLLLCALPFVAANRPYLCIVLLCLAFGFNGSVTQSVFANVHDVAPNYASTVLSLGNALGVASGFLSPIIITHLTRERNTIVEWRLVFLVNAVMFVLPALLFMVAGSGDVQPWNDAATVAEEKMEKCKDRDVDEEAAAHKLRRRAGAEESC